jgi:outer membrane protein assembly factor BamB
MQFRKFLVFIFLTAVIFNPAFTQDNDTRQWPQFRGYLGQGVMDRASLPVKWDRKSGENIRWETPVPGLAHSCPVIWDNHLFITTAVSSAPSDSLKIGLYGDIDMADDSSVHQFKVYCLDKMTGKIIWERTAYEGVPKERRHTKSTYANPTPATDGRNLVVSFGSHGLFCYDFGGKLLWKKDLGNLATGPYNETGVEWGYSSSPVIHEGKVVIQCDLLKDSFLAIYDLVTGAEVWRIAREAISSWGSPCIYAGVGKTSIILNGYPYIGAYDFATGKEIWKIGDVGDAPAPTAVVAHDLIYINSAHGKYSPILAIRPDASGDITLPAGSTSGNHVAWSFKRGGAYMASPLVYGNYLYNMQINGQLTCVNALTGDVLYKKELEKAFSASGVASDGKLFFPAETGEIFVVEAGPEYRLLAENTMDDVCMATPAITGNMIIFRTQHSLIAIGNK